MIDHLELKTRSLSDCATFYVDILRPLGYEKKLEGPVIGMGAGGTMDLFLMDGDPSENVHYAFGAASRAAVDAPWNAGREGQHKLHRAPVLASHIHPNYYACYFRDPDGRLVEIVCQNAE